MAYNPGTQYRGDLYLYQALTNLGEKAGEAISNYRKDRAESQFLEEQAQGLYDTARRQSNLIRLDDPEVAKALEDNITDMGKFGAMSLAQKRAKVAQIRFDLDQLMKAGQTREQGRRADEYLGLQKENVALGRRREEREIEREKAADVAGQAFLQGLQPPGVLGPYGNVSVPRELQPNIPEITPEAIAQAAIAAGPNLDPRLASMYSELLRRGKDWGLRPGQTFDVPGATVVATSPNQAQVVYGSRMPAGQTAWVTETYFDEATGNMVTRKRPQTPQELQQQEQAGTGAAAPPVPEAVSKLVNEYAANQIAMAGGNQRRGPDWLGLRKFEVRNNEIIQLLRKLGYDEQGRLLTVAQGPNATAANLQPGPSLAQPVFENLPLGGQTNWGGANIRYRGRKE